MITIEFLFANVFLGETKLDKCISENNFLFVKFYLFCIFFTFYLLSAFKECFYSQGYINNNIILLLFLIIIYNSKFEIKIIWDYFIQAFLIFIRFFIA